MADKSTIEQMLESLVNDDQAKAEELFHEYVVTKSREIYESLIESELDDEEDLDEAAEEDEEDEEKDLDENYEDIAIEADDEMDDMGGMGGMGGDPTDDLAGELGDEEDEMGEKSEEELFQDLDSIVDELQAKFDELKGGEDQMGADAGEEEQESFEPEMATVREYVEKVPAGHGAEKKGQAEKADGSAGGMKFQKNDMGGTTANILSGRNGATGSETGALKGNGLLKGGPKEDNAGNINVPGAKNGNAFSTKEPGHGAEKKGSAESADNKQSLFRGRR
jgi:hypothetical protein